jgi:hypothetical protein
MVGDAQQLNARRAHVLADALDVMMRMAGASRTDAHDEDA